MKTNLVQGYFTNDKEFNERKSLRKTYKETSLDTWKKKVSFRIIAIDDKYTIEFNENVILKENRSIKKANNNGFVYYVTECALSRLKKIYSYTTDF